MSTDASTPESPAAHKSKKGRSSPYPAIPFPEALEKARLIWNAEKRHPVSRDLAAKHIGYKGVNGAVIPVLSALKKYGLLVAADGDDLRISEDANKVFILPDGDPERASIIKKLAMLPSLFGDVLAKFPDGLPSDMNLRARLRLDHGFASDEAASTFIRALKASMAIADGLDGSVPAAENWQDSNASEVPAMPVQTTVAATVAPPPPISMQSPPPSTRPAGPAPAPGPDPQQAPALHEQHKWKLADGVWAEITITGKLGSRSFEKLKKYVALIDVSEDTEGGGA